MNRRGFLAALVAAPVMPLVAKAEGAPVAGVVHGQEFVASIGYAGRWSWPVVLGRCAIDQFNADEMNPFSLSADIGPKECLPVEVVGRVGTVEPSS